MSQEYIQSPARQAVQGQRLSNNAKESTVVTSKEDGRSLAKAGRKAGVTGCTGREGY